MSDDKKDDLTAKLAVRRMKTEIPGAVSENRPNATVAEWRSSERAPDDYIETHAQPSQIPNDQKRVGRLSIPKDTPRGGRDGDGNSSALSAASTPRKLDQSILSQPFPQQNSPRKEESPEKVKGDRGGQRSRSRSRDNRPERLVPTAEDAFPQTVPVSVSTPPVKPSTQEAITSTRPSPSPLPLDRDESAASAAGSSPLSRGNTVTLTPSAVHPGMLPSGGASGGFLRTMPHQQQHPGDRTETILSSPFPQGGSVAAPSPFPDHCSSADSAAFSSGHPSRNVLHGERRGSGMSQEEPDAMSALQSARVGPPSSRTPLPVSVEGPFPTDSPLYGQMQMHGGNAARGGDGSPIGIFHMNGGGPVLPDGAFTAAAAAGSGPPLPPQGVVPAAANGSRSANGREGGMKGKKKKQKGKAAAGEEDSDEEDERGRGRMYLEESGEPESELDTGEEEEKPRPPSGRPQREFLRKKEAPASPDGSTWGNLFAMCCVSRPAKQTPILDKARGDASAVFGTGLFGGFAPSSASSAGQTGGRGSGGGGGEKSPAAAAFAMGIAAESSESSSSSGSAISESAESGPVRRGRPGGGDESRRSAPASRTESLSGDGEDGGKKKKKKMVEQEEEEEEEEPERTARTAR
uniref:Uncharacterized protein n=1 Tax=Chromera velia CCMP2878 TaxID=1169474 RepID=A0A0G4HTQ7_9ALVE|eukprot:Cvel_8472.t1-p1 / transcript=Cvel_8472.t1 / gene=Cvel_8472 / organism=Chromera_velia_CCMP2878 / gene_product=hypothetical protein / transcript_product=hypothetical protein / location=Cvel_scaffold468:18296-21926(+) / protein_length=632 / sequence_SO=supercontig / SO=protein_coding / is_pseudo=false